MLAIMSIMFTRRLRAGIRGFPSRLVGIIGGFISGSIRIFMSYTGPRRDRRKPPQDNPSKNLSLKAKP